MSREVKRLSVGSSFSTGCRVLATREAAKVCEKIESAGWRFKAHKARKWTKRVRSGGTGDGGSFERFYKIRLFV